MKISELKTLLELTGYPVAYDHFIGEQEMPYITIVELSSDNFFADTKVLQTISNMGISLYTKKKDIVAEAKVELALTNMKWNKIEYFNDSEQCFEIIYSIQIMKENE